MSAAARGKVIFSRNRSYWDLFSPYSAPEVTNGPKYKREQAKQRCADATEKDNPCCGDIKPVAH
jgi:hypothetical protein